MKEIDYNKLRLDVLQKLITHHQIECKETRNEMIKYLQLNDEGKYVRETTVEKYDKDKFLIGIDLAKRDQLIQMGKLIEQGEAKEFFYANARKYYISSVNILENEE